MYVGIRFHNIPITEFVLISAPVQVIALLIADVTHIAVTSYGLGLEKTLDVTHWNPMTWGNVGVTVGNATTYVN